jgi:hypothetical protein
LAFSSAINLWVKALDSAAPAAIAPLADFPILRKKVKKKL